MDLRGYLFRVNQNNGFKLNDDELKDVIQDVTIIFEEKSLNDALQKKTALREYQTACRRKIQKETFAFDLEYFERAQAESDHEKEQRRRALIPSLNLTRAQKKIVDLLVKGFSYEEIRRKLRISASQLWSQVRHIKTRNPQTA